MRGTEVSEFIDSAYIWEERANKAEAENARLRKVVDAAGEYTKHFDEFVNSKGIVTSYDKLKQALAELDKEGNKRIKCNI
jgi:hypothetical protein